MGAEAGGRAGEGSMDPYAYIAARYAGPTSEVAERLQTLDPPAWFRVANDLGWLLAEIGRLRAIEAAARAVASHAEPLSNGWARLTYAGRAAVLADLGWLVRAVGPVAPAAIEAAPLDGGGR